MLFINDTATTEIYTLSLHDALPILPHTLVVVGEGATVTYIDEYASAGGEEPALSNGAVELFVGQGAKDRKSTRLNSSHANISYAVFCLQIKSNEHTSALQSPHSLVC